MPGPYVLAGHSLGGLLSRIYAATYPDEVVGLVLLDSYSEFLEPIIGPKLWPKLVKFNAANGKPVPIPGYGDSEAIPYGSADAYMRQLKVTSPLRPMPLAMLTHGKPFRPSEGPRPLAGVHLQADRAHPVEGEPGSSQAGARRAVLHREGELGHDIHQDQPALTANESNKWSGVRSPDTWYSLQTCCRT